MTAAASGSAGDRPLRILHVVESAFAGVGRSVLDLAEAQVRGGDIVDVLYGSARADERFLTRLAASGVRRATSFGAGRAMGPADLLALLAVRRSLRRDGPYDIVHGHASKAGAYVRAGCGRRSTSVIYTPQAFITQSPELSGPARRVYSTVERLLARRTAGLIHVSRQEADHATALGLAPRRTTIIPNGIPFVQLPSRDATRSMFGWDPETLIVGCVGRLERQKGLDLLIRALPLVEAPAGPWQLVVVGEGGEREALVSLARDLGVEERITWLGKRDGQATMPAFDLFALPSRYEGFPYVVLEALWAEVAVLATSTSCVDDIFDAVPAGLIVPPTPSALAAALSTVLSDPAVLASMRLRARDAVAPYDVAGMARLTRDFYGLADADRRSVVDR